MTLDYDIIIIGSGFGGAVCAYRLAAAGFRVCVLERGRRWTTATYPRKLTDSWTWKKQDPRNFNGWIDLHTSPEITVVQGAGVGGGSLIYSGVTIDAEAVAFTQAGWPKGVNWFRELKERYYPKVEAILQPEELPDAQFTSRATLIKEAAEKVGESNHFAKLGLTIHFDANFRPADFRPEELISDERLAELEDKGACVHLGNCNIGCKVGAKKTLDKNYIKLAEDAHAVVYPLHLVSQIEPLNAKEPQQGYRVYIDDLASLEEQKKMITASIVVVAAGSLGSTELMLRCRQDGVLPKLSPKLGTKWSYNGDVNSLALYLPMPPIGLIEPMRGPHTTARISFMAGENKTAQRFLIEDAGFPKVLYDYLQSGHNQETIGSLLGKKLVQILGLLAWHEGEDQVAMRGEATPLTPEEQTQLGANLLTLLRQIDAGKPPEDEQVQGIATAIRAALKKLGRLPTDFVMPWFAEGLDAGDGRVSLTTVEAHFRALYDKEQDPRSSERTKYFSKKGKDDLLGRPTLVGQNSEEILKTANEENAGRLHESTLSIQPGSAGLFKAVRKKHQEIIEQTHGNYLSTDDVKDADDDGEEDVHVITTHPLGGCPMGDTVDDGVVDHKGEVFNYPNLYIADGSIIPTAIGANPSKTIAALAERIAELIVSEKQYLKQAALEYDER